MVFFIHFKYIFKYSRCTTKVRYLVEEDNASIFLYQAIKEVISQIYKPSRGITLTKMI